jgi:DNA end-binding protein Ku
MARPLWSGAITFGLVNIPVRMVTAVREQRVSFHQLHEKTHARLQRKMVCSIDGREVHSEHVVRGYEYEKDKYVVVRDAELEALAPKESKTIEIAEFVDADQIDPLFYDSPYYLAPGERAAKAYKLLTDAMTEQNMVGISKFVMRDREYLAALRPLDGIIVLSTMHFSNEVLSPKDIIGPIHHREDIPNKELKMASDLIESLSGKFEPERYKDEYRLRVHKLIEEKAKGREIVAPPAAEEEQKPGKVINLMAALEQSLAEAKKNRKKLTAAAHAHTHSGGGGGGGASGGRRRKSA